MDGLSGDKRRRQRIRFETDRHTIVGDVTLPAEGYQARFSDAINRPEVEFISLIDVEIEPLHGGGIEKHEFMVLAKAHVRLACPVEDE
jgi:hypothetical protein